MGNLVNGLKVSVYFVDIKTTPPHPIQRNIKTMIYKSLFDGKFS